MTKKYQIIQSMILKFTIFPIPLTLGQFSLHATSIWHQTREEEEMNEVINAYLKVSFGKHSSINVVHNKVSFSRKTTLNLQICANLL